MILRAVYKGKEALIEKGFSVVQIEIVEEALIVCGVEIHRARLDKDLRSLDLICVRKLRSLLFYYF